MISFTATRTFLAVLLAIHATACTSEHPTREGVFDEGTLRDLKSRGTLQVKSLLTAKHAQPEFFCLLGPSSSSAWQLRVLAVEAQKEQAFNEYVRGELARGANDTYLVVASSDGGHAALPFYRWRVAILGESEALCSRDTAVLFRYREIGWLWLNRFNSVR